MYDLEQQAPPKRKAVSSRKKPSKLPLGCSECRSRPFVTVMRGGRYVADRCTCERGQALRAKDKAR